MRVMLPYYKAMNTTPQPPPVAPLPRNQRNIDLDHLNLLAVLYYVSAGLALFGIFFIMVYCAIIRFVFTNPVLWQNQKDGPPPQAIFGILMVFCIIGGLCLLASAILNLLSGIFLHTRRHRIFSIVVAGINCLHIPLGTALGIFTIIVLSRDSVRQLYAESH